VEFIPEGSAAGPVKEIYFKIFKAGTCGIVGAVLGWPQLDCPSIAGGEGLGWINQIDGARYSALNVTLPRADKERKMQYLQSTARYTASQGSLLAIAEQKEQDRVSLIDGGRQLRAAALMDAPSAKMDPIGLECVILNPGERAGVPVIWTRPRNELVTECSTHPEAPPGLQVLPGTCEAKDSMTIVVENAGELPITISEHDYLAIGLGEDDIPSLDAYMQIHEKQEKFQSKIKWKKEEIKGKDEERKIDSLS
jgi:hypothetical protein